MSAAGGEHGTIRGMIHRIAHALPAQAPLTEFIHHNTLHADQPLGFHAAIARASARSGAQGYPAAATLRAAWRSGRIRPAALEEALADHPELQPEEIALPLPGAPLRRGGICALLLGAADGDDPAPPGFLLRRLAQLGAGERALWDACCAQVGLAGGPAGGLDQGGLDQEPEPEDRQQAAALAQESLARSFEAPIPPAERIASICGADLLAGVAPEVIPFAAAALDEGQARVAPAGLYRAWRAAQAASHGDRAEVVWPDDPESLLAARLESLPAAHREPVLERIAWRCPGWAGMIAWREAHPDWPPQAAAPVRLAEWLAVWWAEEERLAARLAARHWGLPPEALAAELRRCPEEFWCRRLLYAGELPEPLADRARYAAGRIHDAPQAAWRTLAAAVYAGIYRPDRPGARLRRAGAWLWPAFRLLHRAGAGAAGVAALPAGSLGRLCDLLPALRAQVFGPVGLEAFEADYRRGVVGLLRAAPPDDPGLPGAPADPADPDGAARGRAVPDVQVVFCIDEREEAFRRHLEQAGADLGLRLETFGAAGFFGLPMRHLPLHAERAVPLCPPAIRPDRTVREIPGDPAESERQRRLRRRLGRLAQAARAPWLLPLLPLLAPLLLGWIGLMIAAPAQIRRLTDPVLQRLLPPIPARQTLDPDPADPDVGFSPEEQADRLARLFTQIGLGRSGRLPGPAPLVLLLAHGSSSLNNPHRAAYACGACGGRHGGPNARAVATLANRPGVRQMLRTRGIHIPDSTVFLAGEHDTGSEEIVFFDTAPERAPDPDGSPARPAGLQAALQIALQAARAASAQERCRRFASAPVAPGGGPPDAQAALRHVGARTRDIGQARPELGHATNAAAIIGRRSRSRGISLDRRSFLVSYDPTDDPGGVVLEGILLAVGPVGAGISLEYYFSSVDPERFGCGSKLPHNLQGRFAVMEGTEGDLRTGLPRQMTEIHEPMRLLMIVEAAPDVLGAILARQPALRELIDGEWVQLLALSPGGGQAELLRYRPGHGFSPCS